MGSKGSTTTTSKSSLPKEFLTGYTNALKMAGQAVNTPYQAYQGQLVAGLNPTQTQGISNVNAAQGMALPAIQKGMDLTQEASKGITPELYNQFYSPYVRDVADATQKNLLESNAQQTSGLKSGAIQAGAFGGDRGGVAQAEMARQQDLANGQTMANVYNQGYGQAMGLAGQQAQNYGAMGQQMAGLGTAAQGSVLQGAQAQMAAGSQQQNTEQAQLSAAYDQYMQRLAYPYQQAQFYANIAEGLGSTAGGTSTTSTPGPSWGSQVLGGLGAIGSIFSMSDERMKEDIQPIGELFDGQTIYRYRFKDEPKGTTRIGLMAQDVEKKNPRAVREINGVKGVDYRDATDEAASAGGLVPAGGGRMGFAEGGMSFYPWGGVAGWVPEGKTEGGGESRIPEPPKPYDPASLSEDWSSLKPLTEDQVSGLNGMRLRLGIPMPGDSTDPVMASRGGLARARYAGGGGASSGVMIMPDGPDPEVRSSPAMIRVGSDAVDTAGTGDRIPTNEEVDAYVAKAAAAKGIDPDVAVRLWHAEGRSGDPREAWRSKSIIKGKRESSFSPLQLNVEGGVGAQMIKDTGVDPSKLENWKPSVDYGLEWAKKNGWDDWMGAKAIGLKPREGLPSIDGGIAPASDPNPTADGGSPVPEGGLMIPGEKPKFDMRRFFASEENPNIIESVMGKRMSPEARNAVMAASFAMLAGRSPFMGVNIGEAGKVGMQTYYNALKQKADVAQTIAETGKTGIEGEVSLQDLRQKIMTRYQLDRANFRMQPGNDGKEFMPFAAWAKKYNFPEFIAGGNEQGATAPTNSPPLPGPAEITDGQNTETARPGETPRLGVVTVLADPEEIPAKLTEGTLPWYEDMQIRAMKASLEAGTANPEQMKAFTNLADSYGEKMNAILGSDAYKNRMSFNSQYVATKEALEKLARINTNYEGNRLADVKADMLGVAQSLGITLPEGWADTTAAYDETMKNAMTVAIANAEKSGGFSNAPASMLDASGHVTPMPQMAPAARYSMIKTMLADLNYKNDLFNTWDQGPNFAQHQAEFNAKHPFSDYMEHADSVLPKPALPPNSGDPSDPESAAASGRPVAQDKQELYDTKAPNAVDGTVIKRNGTVIAKKVGGVWVQP